MPSAADPKALLSRTPIKMPNSMGARTQPCFTPLLTMVRFVSSRNDFTMPRSVGEQPTLARIKKMPSLLIMSKALVSEVYEGL